jgi:fucose permease
MFLLGGIQNTKGLVLEHVQRDIGLDIGQIGTLVAVFQIGFLVASLLAGYLTDRRGIKVTMLAGALLMAAGLTGTSGATGVLFFLGFYLVIGLGIGTMLVSIVTIIPRFYKERAALMFNVSNAMFGVGMILMPLALQALFAHQLSWRTFYIGLTVVVGLVIVVLNLLKLERGGSAEIGLRDVFDALARADVAIVVLFLLVYVAAEASFLNFFPIFYGSLDVHGQSFDEKSATAAYVISSFAFLFTIGRFIGGFITDRLGDRLALIGFSFFALAAVIAGRWLATTAIYTFMIFGFALSVLFPTASAVASRLTDRSGSVMGLIYMASGLGGALGGYVVGKVSGVFGISVGFDVIIGFVGLVAILSPLVGRPARPAQSR